MNKQKVLNLAAGSALVIMTLVVYVPAMQGGFIWDDDLFVGHNELLRSANGLERIWLDLEATPYQYFPMVFTTYWLEYQLWGSNPTGYHVVNMLLHAIAAILLWRILGLLKLPGAWIAAAVFALHPVHVESVAWITERKNVLSAVFYLGSLLAYLHFSGLVHESPGTGRSVRLYLLSLGLFVLALLSKTVTCTLPAALMVVHWWKHKLNPRRVLPPLLPFFIVGIGLGLLTVWMEKNPNSVGAMGPEWAHTFVERCLIAGRAVCFYAGKLIWPAELMFIYPQWPIDAGAARQYLYPLVVAGAMGGLWLARGRIGRGPFAAACCFVGTLFPALGFFNVYFMRYSFVSDHFQYLASIALITLVVSSGMGLGRRLGASRFSLVFASVIVSVTLGVQTWRQAGVYRNAETLWRDAISKNADAWMAHNNLGVLLKNRGKSDEAIAHYEQSLRVKPDAVESLTCMGSVLIDYRRLDEAQQYLQRALQIDPDYAAAHNNMGMLLSVQGRLEEALVYLKDALAINPGSMPAQNNMGSTLARLGRVQEAIPYFRRAVERNPESAPAHFNLAKALQSVGALGEALPHYVQAVRFSPGSAGYRHRLGQALEFAGRHDEAMRVYESALKLRPTWPTALSSVARVLVTHPNHEHRDTRRAIQLAEQACLLSERRDPQALDILALAYAADGRHAKAADTARAALALAEAGGLTELASEIRRHLEQFGR
ncbi:MAG: tetratricopeptide repeat protein [Phycisphaerae bacterium]